MKRTGDNTVMIEMPGSRFYEVRGEAVVADDPIDDCFLRRPELARFNGKRVLILELVNQK